MNVAGAVSTRFPRLWSLLGHPGLLLEEPESLPDAV